MLTTEGHRVVAVSSASEALNRFGERDFAVVISDMKPPKMDGMAVLKNLKQRSSKIPVILTDSKGDVRKCCQGNAGWRFRLYFEIRVCGNAKPGGKKGC
jgi:DNA-binding NtrC family response regulator